MTRRLLSVVLLSALLAGGGSLAGCGSETIVDVVPVDEGLDQQRRQAGAALARYDEAIRDVGGRPRFVPIGELTGVTGEWDPAAGDAGKRAVAAGRVVPGNDLPAPPRRTGVVDWGDGATLTLPLISATQAIDEMAVAAHREDCGGCRPLEATSARLTTVTLSTTRGDAEVPAWRYRLAGTEVEITRPAVARSAGVRITPPSWDPYHAPAGLAIEAATTETGSRAMTVAFTGSPGPASQPCGADYTAEVVESRAAVVVIVRAEPNPAEPACPSIGAGRTAEVVLDEPLGERAVLEVQQGLPVPVTTTR